MTYSTRMHWGAKHWVASLFCGAKLVAQMSLDEWIELSVNKVAIDDAVRQAVYTARHDALGLQ
jgi:hypothetical protein